MDHDSRPSQLEYSAKLKQAQSLATQATSYEFSKSYLNAFEHYLKAIQIYQYLIRHSESVQEANRFRSVCTKLLERATRIKTSGKLGNTSFKHVVKGDRFSVENQDDIIEKSRFVQGRSYERWTDTLPQTRLPSSSTTWQPPLISPETNHYQPIRRILPDARMIGPEPSSGTEIVQNNIGDCSLVSSLIVCAEHQTKWGSQLATGCLYPKDETGEPRFSQDGIYEAKFLINGAWRKIGTSSRLIRHAFEVFRTHARTILLAVFNDQLPCSIISNEPMFATTFQQDQLWPSLIEKAYMTLVGAYDFIGSNSGIDIHALTGWIPEHISLTSKFQPEKTWQRIVKGFNKGSCVITLGTGKTVSDGWEPRHSYAIVDLKEVEDRRELYVVNPWRTSSWTQDMKNALPGQVEERRPIVIDWDTISNDFEALHLNWDPRSWENSSAVHGSIPSSPAPMTSNNPSSQSTHLRLRLPKPPTLPTEMWILLSRHRQSMDDVDEYIGLNVVKSWGVVTTGNADLSSNLTDNPFLLYRFVADSSTSSYDLFISHRGPRSSSEEFRFTLRAMAPFSIAIEDGPPPLAYSRQIDSSWTTKTAGGNHTHPTFYQNPQYSIKLSSIIGKPNLKGVLSVMIETKKDVPVNIRLVRSRGERVDRLEERDVLGGSSTYNHGFSSLRVDKLVPDIPYTLIISTFSPETFATFSLRIESDLELGVEPIPAEGAGMFSRTGRGKWTLKNMDDKILMSRWIISDVKKITTVQIRLQALNDPPIPLSLSIYPLLSDGSIGNVQVTTGSYSDQVCGVVTKSIKLSPNQKGYLVVPGCSIREFREEVEYKILLYADQAIGLSEIG